MENGERRISALLTSPPTHSVDNKKERGEWKEEKFHSPTLLNSARLHKSKEEK
jgi:hypothetical protein